MAKILSHGVNIFFNISNNENLKKYQEIARSLGAKVWKIKYMIIFFSNCQIFRFMLI